MDSSGAPFLVDYSLYTDYNPYSPSMYRKLSGRVYMILETQIATHELLNTLYNTSTHLLERFVGNDVWYLTRHEIDADKEPYPIFQIRVAITQMLSKDEL